MICRSLLRQFVVWRSKVYLTKSSLFGGGLGSLPSFAYTLQRYVQHVTAVIFLPTLPDRASGSLDIASRPGFEKGDTACRKSSTLSSAYHKTSIKTRLLLLATLEEASSSMRCWARSKVMCNTSGDSCCAYTTPMKVHSLSICRSCRRCVFGQSWTLYRYHR